MPSTAVVLFTRDLRVHDNPALSEAIRRADRVVPLFVLDDGILSSDFARPNRVHFLVECLRDLRASLEQRGGRLLVRRGESVAQTVSVARETGASSVHVAEDVTSYAAKREARLRDALAANRIALEVTPGVTAVPPGEVVPVSGDHYKIFTPYWREWRKALSRPLRRAPREVKVPSAPRSGVIPDADSLVSGAPSPDLATGGESVARKRFAAFKRTGLDDYEQKANLLSDDATSRLSPYLHFGCISPLEVALGTRDRQGGDAFVRQLCWREFFHQVNAANPRYPRDDYRPKGDRWRRSDKDLERWKSGRTGYPIVDAGMRQLQREGWMHNRARLITASFLAKDLYIDWRLGAAHFWDLLVDGDIANNAGNWQWVAGTGNDSRPNRVLNSLRQAERFDPDGDYVRRYVPELADIPGKAVHEPWKLDEDERSGLDYPEPMIDHAEAARRFKEKRS